MSVLSYLRLPLFIGISAILAGIACLFVFFLVAGGSRGAWTTLGAVVASLVALAINLVFDLQGSKSTVKIAAEYTFDASIPQLRQWIYARSLAKRYATEVLASDVISKTSPDVFNDRDTLTRDMIIFSLIAYLEASQHDWQAEPEVYATALSTITTTRFKSNPTDPRTCTKIDRNSVHRMMEKTGNAFAHVNSTSSFPYFCLPPNARIEINGASITLATPFCSITFVVEQPFLELNTMLPGSNIDDTPLLRDGKPRFETRLMGISATRKMRWILAQNKDFAKYEAWSKNLVEGAKVWFETKTTSEAPPWFGGDGTGDTGMSWAGTGTAYGSVWVRGGTVYHEPPK